MVILTKLSKNDIIEILDKYNLGDYYSHKYIDFPLSNTNYIIKTHRKKYILKIFEGKPLTDIKYTVNIEAGLSKKIETIPKIVKSNNGVFIKFKNKYMVIYEYAKGIPPKRLTKKVVGDLGKEIGKLHQKLSKLREPQRKGWTTADKILKNLSSKYKTTFVKKEYDKLMDCLADIQLKNLKKIIIHGDLKEDNILVNKGKISAILDFGDLHRDYLVYDLAILISNVFISAKRVRKDLLLIFFQNYNKYIRLNNEEKKALYCFVLVRLMGVIIWQEMMLKKHKDKQKEIQSWIDECKKKYYVISSYSDKEFFKNLITSL